MQMLSAGSPNGDGPGYVSALGPKTSFNVCPGNKPPREIGVKGAGLPSRSTVSALCKRMGSEWGGYEADRGGGVSQRWVSSRVSAPRSCRLRGVPRDGMATTGASSGTWASGSERMMYLRVDKRADLTEAAAQALQWGCSILP